MGTQEPAGVLDKLAPEGDGEGEEERVELGQSETLAEVLAGRDDYQQLLGRGAIDSLEKGGACARPETTLEHDR
jgi:hypothetical protein